ncbi:septation protein IspZ [Hoeflea sp. CAU 1731]
MVDHDSETEHADWSRSDTIRFASSFIFPVVFLLSYFYAPVLVSLLPWLAHLGGPLFLATAVALAAGVVRRILASDPWPKYTSYRFYTFCVIFIFGFAGILLRDEGLIKIVPTLTLAILAVASLLSVGSPDRRSPLIPERNSTSFGHTLLALYGALFLIILAVANEIVWRSFSTDVWVVWRAFYLFVAAFLVTMPASFMASSTRLRLTN